MNTKGIIKDLKRTFAVLRSREKWVQGAYRTERWAEDSESYVEMYCLVGAMRSVNASSETLTYLAGCLPGRPTMLQEAVMACGCPNCRAQQTGETLIVNWNDRSSTTHEDVVLLLKSAIYALEEEE